MRTKDFGFRPYQRRRTIVTAGIHQVNSFSFTYYIQWAIEIQRKLQAVTRKTLSLDYAEAETANEWEGMLEAINSQLTDENGKRIYPLITKKVEVTLIQYNSRIMSICIEGRNVNLYIVYEREIREALGDSYKPILALSFKF